MNATEEAAGDDLLQQNCKNEAGIVAEEVSSKEVAELELNTEEISENCTVEKSDICDTLTEKVDEKPQEIENQLLENSSVNLKRTLEDSSDDELIAAENAENVTCTGYFIDPSKAAWFRGIVSYDSSDSDSDSDSEDSSSSSSSSEKEESSDDSSILSDCKSADLVPKGSMKFVIPKTKGELTLDDLPPIEELKISVPAHEMVHMGEIHAIVDNLVVVKSILNFPAIDLDSVLFFKSGQPMGKVFDVLGPVVQPLYSIRFNSVEQIKEKGIEKNLAVFCAPNVVDATSFVFLAQITSVRGSDASWLDNNECPTQFADYSDDEQEKRAKAARRNQSGQNDGRPDTRKSKKERKRNNSVNTGAAGEGIPETNVSQQEGHRFPPPYFQRNFQPNFLPADANFSPSPGQFASRDNSPYMNSANFQRSPHPRLPLVSRPRFRMTCPRFPPHRFGAPSFPFRHNQPDANYSGNMYHAQPRNPPFTDQWNSFRYPPPGI